jgi:uncharacterized protein (TIGR03663 family)
MNWGRVGFAAAVASALAVSLLLRLPNLGIRPMHGDEAVHAFKFAELWERGAYHYDPNEYHGPTLYYLALPVVWLSGHHRFADMQEADFRRGVALAGAAMVPLLLLLTDGLGRRGTAVAMLLTAVSPAFVFYSRYYIQEVPLTFFTLGALGCAWRYRQSGRTGWLFAAAVFAGLMLATKETALFAFAAAVVAWLVTGWRLPAAAAAQSAQRAAQSAGTVGRFALSAMRFAAPVVALAVAFLFLSGFFSDPDAPLRYVHAFAFWGRRGVGETPHVHPWNYYLSLLLWNQRAHKPIWSEALILVLAVFGVRYSVFGPDHRFDYIEHNTPTTEHLPPPADTGFLRFLAVYTLALGVIYCAVPYKTPWLILTPLIGLIPLAGAGAAWILEALRSRAAQVLAGCLLLGGVAQLGWQARAASVEYCTSAGNPYVYAQPSPDVVELGRQVEKLARASPEADSVVVKVIAADPYYWPLPWYLRRLRNVGYWTQIPPNPDAPVVIVSSAYDPDEALNPRLPQSLMTGYYGLRPGVMFELWVRTDLWQRYLRNLPG